MWFDFSSFQQKNHDQQLLYIKQNLLCKFFLEVIYYTFRVMHVFNTLIIIKHGQNKGTINREVEY